MRRFTAGSGLCQVLRRKESDEGTVRSRWKMERYTGREGREIESEEEGEQGKENILQETRDKMTPNVSRVMNRIAVF